MSLTHDHKRYIKRNLKTSTVPAIAAHLKIPEKEILDYLKDHWREDKYQEFIKKTDAKRDPESSIEEKLSQGFSLRAWIKSNKFQLIFLSLLVFFTYANTLPNAFVSDDIGVIVTNPSSGTWESVTSNPIAFPRPLLYYIIQLLFDKNPLPFHLLNIFFHTGNTLLFFALVSFFITPAAGFMAALLFGVHPILSEGVTWISGGGYSQYTFFLFAALLTFIMSFKNKTYYWWSLGFATMSLFSGDRGVFPFIVALFLFLFTNFRKTWTKAVPYFAIASIWIFYYVSLITTRIENVKHEQFTEKVSFNPFFQLPVAITSYLYLLAWPDKLSIYHSDFIMSSVAFGFRVFVFIAFIVYTLYSFFKNKRIFFWLSFFFITLAPTLTPFGISSLVAERYAYIGTTGIFFATAYYLWKISKQKQYETLVYLVFMIVIGLLAVRTVVRNFDWYNEDTLWVATGKVATYDPVAHMNLGDMHRRHKDFVMAEKEFKHAIQLSPNNAYAYYNLGLTYTEANAFEQAVAAYEKAVSIDPGLWQGYQNLSVVYFQTGQNEKAFAAIQKSVTIAPPNSELFTNLGLISASVNKRQEAEQAFKKAVELNPANEKAKSALIQLQSEGQSPVR